MTVEAALECDRRRMWLRIAGAVVLVLLVSLLSWNAWLALDARSQMATQLTEQRQRDREHLFWLLCHEHATAAQRVNAFLQLVAAGNTEWRSARLSQLELEGADMAGVRLSQAAFVNCNLTKSELTQADLTQCDLQLTDLSDASLRKANLSEATLLKTKLDRADLREANLRSASLEQAVAHDANFVLADLGDAHLLMADLTNANLTGADLTNANLEAAILTGADLTLARCGNVNFTDTNLADCKWWRARGLSTELISRFQKQFAPSKNTPQRWRDDYSRWNKTRPMAPAPP